MGFFKRLFGKKEKPAIVVAKIVSVSKHPNADKLNVLSVDCGDKELQQIVCGAPNVRPGLIGVLARPGAVLPEFPTPLAARALRGVMSNGMMCSAAELGCGTDNGGILELPENSKIGAKYE